MRIEESPVKGCVYCYPEGILQLFIVWTKFKFAENKKVTIKDFWSLPYLEIENENSKKIS